MATNVVSILPWLRYPEIHGGDIFWRMGAGEDTVKVGWEWVRDLQQHQRREYLLQQCPSPEDGMLPASEIYAWPYHSDDALDEAWEILEKASGHEI